MVRRLLILSGFLVFTTVARADVWWQPEGLQKNIVERFVRHIEKTTPYRIEFKSVGGNFFSVFALEGVRIRAEGVEGDIVTAKSIHIDLHWKSLLEKKVVLQRIVLDEPVIQLRIGKDKKWDLPEVKPSKDDQPSPPLTIDHLEIKLGRVKIVNNALRPSQTLELRPISMVASLTSNAFVIHSFQIGMGSGHIATTGSIAVAKSPQMDLTLSARDFPLHQLLKLQLVPPRELRMHYSGDWRITRKDNAWKAILEGRLEGAPLAARLTGEMKGATNMELELEPLSVKRIWVDDSAADLGKLSASIKVTAPASGWKRMNANGTVRAGEMGSAVVRLAQGRGPIAIVLHREGLAGSATAQVDLSAESSAGEFEVKISTLQPVIARGSWKGPWDRPSVLLKAELPNKTVFEYAGRAQSSKGGWKFLWNKMTLSPEEAPALETAQPGEAYRDASGAWQVENLVLVSKGGKLFVDKARYEKPAMDFHIRTANWDPSSLNFLWPQAQMKAGGTLNLKARVYGPFPKISVDGSLVADIPLVELSGAGLTLLHVKTEILSQGKTFEIKRFTAETKKKGSLEITGKSTFPSLDVQLIAKKLYVNKPKRWTGIASATLQVKGTLDGPEVRGDIHLHKGTYQVLKLSRKEKKKQEKEKLARGNAPPSDVWENTVMDVRATWPRNVWYRNSLSKIETSGDLRIQKDRGLATPYLTGSIGIVRGTYDAYGRDFTLESGNIAFTGPPEINPLLNIEATYKSGGTVVYLLVKGTANAPEITLRSNPPLAQQDIVSVLVVGQPLNQVRPSTAGTEPTQSAQAQALAGSVVGSMITKQLRESGMDVLGLDVVRVEPTNQGNLLVVGRYIGSSVFVSYGQPLQATAARTYKGEYYLTTHWTMVGQSGTPETAQANPTTIDSKMSLQFRYPLNTPK